MTGIKMYTTLQVECGEWPVDEVVEELEHEPNGTFWECMADLVAPEAFEKVDTDSEADTFICFGDHESVLAIREALEPLLTDRDKLRIVLSAAIAEGYEFDD